MEDDDHGLEDEVEEDELDEEGGIEEGASHLLLSPAVAILQHPPRTSPLHATPLP
jgi:hypothetical protein